ncbi:penicillin-binding protein 2, partial [Streptomyces sp. SID3212]|nr:penicillin-binding protein 2 [Streptomyces sp. SID3212]
MIRQIRHTTVFCLLLLVALFVNAGRIQVIEADTLDDNPANRRQTVARFEQRRGNILVDGRAVTGSKDTGEQLRFERTYTDGPLYAPVTGYASQTYGTTLLENAEDNLLTGTNPLLAPLPFWNDVTRGRQPGGRVATTVRASMQRAAFDG